MLGPRLLRALGLFKFRAIGAIRARETQTQTQSKKDLGRARRVVKLLCSAHT